MIFGLQVWLYESFFVPETKSPSQCPRERLLSIFRERFVNWCSVHYVNRTSFAFAGMTPAMAKAMQPSQMLYIQVV
ncbi:hypothetical protein MY011_28820 [Escherichia coli]|nr:hypothetical protein MY011_28820 [Escherichia coli]